MVVGSVGYIMLFFVISSHLQNITIVLGVKLTVLPHPKYTKLLLSLSFFYPRPRENSFYPSILGWSRVYSFTTYTQTNYQNIANRFIILGDMGWDPQAVNTINILKNKSTFTTLSLLSV
jgi:hypothetical protein